MRGKVENWWQRRDEKEKWIVRFLVFSTVFVAFSFLRYYPVATQEGTYDLRPMNELKGVDSYYYDDGVSRLSLKRNPAAMSKALSLIFTETVQFLSPSSIHGVAVLGVFSLFFAWSVYLFVKDKVKYSWSVFMLTPFSLYIHRITTAGSYGQILAISFFFIALYLWSENHEKFTSISLLAMFVSHAWSAPILLGGFFMYVVFSDRESLKRNWLYLTPLIVIPIVMFWKWAWVQQLISFTLSANRKSTMLWGNLLDNTTNLPSFGLVFLMLISIWKSFKESTLEEIPSVSFSWFSFSVFVMVTTWGSQTCRIWMMLPFLLFAVDGFDYALKKGYIEFIVVSFIYMLMIGWALGA